MQPISFPHMRWYLKQELHPEERRRETTQQEPEQLETVQQEIEQQEPEQQETVQREMEQREMAQQETHRRQQL